MDWEDRLHAMVLLRALTFSSSRFAPAATASALTATPCSLAKSSSSSSEESDELLDALLERFGIATLDLSLNN
jgi:hypothetical protein